ncbi:GAL3A protein [Vespula maculifrons]|uniref:GAL3A protein n=1 Tax=Vespula maculifrons TaxID=7453 RepID=A0ABD2B5C5_VESMC
MQTAVHSTATGQESPGGMQHQRQEEEEKWQLRYERPFLLWKSLRGDAIRLEERLDEGSHGTYYHYTTTPLPQPPLSPPPRPVVTIVPSSTILPLEYYYQERRTNTHPSSITE